MLRAMMMGKRTIYSSDLIAYYKANNNTDEEIAARHGSAGSQTAYATGYDSVANGAFSFNGNSLSQVTIPTFSLGSSSYTIEFYAYITGSLSEADQCLIVNDYTSVTKFGGIFVDTEKGFSYWQNSLIRADILSHQSPFVPAKGQWYKITLVYNGATSKSSVYVSNMLVTTESGTHTETYDNAASFGFRLGGTGAALSGRLDDLKFYNTLRVPTAGLIAHYAAENNTNDSSAGGFHATAGAGTAYVTGASGGADKAFSFVNTNSRVLTPALGLRSAYSVEFWMKLDSGNTNFRVLVSNKWDSAANDFGALYLRDGNKLAYWQNSALRVESGVQSFTVGTWYKIKMTYDGSKTRLYKDDVLIATESGTHSENPQKAIGLGYHANSSWDAPFLGALDEVKFYNAIV